MLVRKRGDDGKKISLALLGHNNKKEAIFRTQTLTPHGKWEFSGGSYPGGPPLTGLKYAGQNQKPILTREARKRDAEIINRVMVYDLLTHWPVGELTECWV